MSENTDLKKYKSDYKTKERDGKICGVSYRFEYENGDFCLMVIEKEDVAINEEVTQPVAKISVINENKANAASISLPMEKSFDKEIGTMEGLMQVYHYLTEDSKMQNHHNVATIRKFMDRYFFNNEENRYLLNKYIQQKKVQTSRLTPKQKISGLKNIWNMLSKKFGKNI